MTRLLSNLKKSDRKVPCRSGKWKRAKRERFLGWRCRCYFSFEVLQKEDGGDSGRRRTCSSSSARRRERRRKEGDLSYQIIACPWLTRADRHGRGGKGGEGGKRGKRKEGEMREDRKEGRKEGGRRRAESLLRFKHHMRHLFPIRPFRIHCTSSSECVRIRMKKK